MAFPSFFIIFLIIIFVFQHHLRKNRKIEEQQKQAYWSKEQASLVVRKKEFSPDDYIHPSIDTLKLDTPTSLSEAEKLYLDQLISSIKSLSTADMMNFSHLTNTEIRLQFGTANQTIITNNEQNYTLFLKALGQYAKLMLEHKEIQEATSALEECIRLNSDFSEHYIQLGIIYHSQNNSSQLEILIAKANQLNSINKKGILDKLESLKSTISIIE